MTFSEFLMRGPKSAKVQKSKRTVMKDAITKFEIIGKIIEEGTNRGFKQEEIIQLISAGVIRL